MATLLSEQAMNKDGFRIVVCASGGGGNFQALIDARSKLGIDIALLVVDRTCGAILRAEKFGIPFFILSNNASNNSVFEKFEKNLPPDIDLIVLAGFMPIVPAYICERWKGKIINTHPSLLPKYGGKGMYGVKVQEAVMQAKEKKAGCTIHFVDANIDKGAIILQKTIEVDYSETAWQLGGRVFQEENLLLVEAVRMIKNTLTKRFESAQ